MTATASLKTGSQEPSDEILIILDPGQAKISGDDRLETQMWMIDKWNGPVLILVPDVNADATDSSMPAKGVSKRVHDVARTYQEILDVLLDERESVGIGTRFFSGGESLSSWFRTLDDMLKNYPGCPVRLTGACTGDRLEVLVRYIETSGRSVQEDSTLIAPLGTTQPDT